jgi:hypothetical protein
VKGKLHILEGLLAALGLSGHWDPRAGAFAVSTSHD